MRLVRRRVGLTVKFLNKFKRVSVGSCFKSRTTIQSEPASTFDASTANARTVIEPVEPDNTDAISAPRISHL